MSVSTDNGLMVLGKAERMLAEVASAQDAIDIIDMAEAARVWAQRAKLGTASINHAQSIKLKAEIKLADVVDEGQRRGEIASPGQPKKPDNVRPTDNTPVPLEDLGKPDCEAWYVAGPKNTFPSVTVYRGGTVDAEYDWSGSSEPIQCEAITLLLADFTRRAGRKPRDGRLP